MYLFFIGLPLAGIATAVYAYKNREYFHSNFVEILSYIIWLIVIATFPEALAQEFNNKRYLDLYGLSVVILIAMPFIYLSSFFYNLKTLNSKKDNTRDVDTENGPPSFGFHANHPPTENHEKPDEKH